MSLTAERAAQYVSFALAGEAYAVDILRAREIVAYDVVTRVPLAPPGIHGVMNLRGQVIPVIDRTFSLADAAEAIRYVHAGHARGKVVIAFPTSQRAQAPID